MTSRPSARWQRPWVAYALGLALVIVWILGSWLGLSRPANVGPLSWTDLIWAAALLLPFSIVGFVLALRVPANPIGWLFLVGPLSAMSGVMIAEIVNHLQESTPSFLPFMSEAVSSIGIGLMAGLFLLLFPNGRLPSPRWRWVMVSVVAGVALVVAWLIGRPCIAWTLSAEGGLPPSCTGDPGPGYLAFENPLFLSSVIGEQVWGLLGAVGSGLVVLGPFAGVASVFVRYRTGSPVERTQLRWLLVLLVVIVAGLGALILGDVVFGVEAEWPSNVLLVSAVTGIPVVIGLAIAKHRLYDLDRLVSRTITYAVVGAFLAVFYAVATIVPVLVLGAGDRGEAPSWLVALSTLGAFALFAPVRHRVQAAVERRFDRARYDAARVLERLGMRVRDSTSLDEVAEEVVGAVDQVLRPGRVSIWIVDP